MTILRSILLRLGIDGAIVYTSLARGIQAIGGIITILFVARYLTEVEQGFYYTFGSIVAIQVFFELGLNGIITQYVAHEVSHLKWENDVCLLGEQKYLSRIASLLHFSVKWYLCFAIALLIVLTIIGFLFFMRYHIENDSVIWRFPWILLAVGTSLNLLLTPILAFFEGLGKVKEVAKIRFYQQSVGFFVVCGGLFLGAKLYTLGLNWLIGLTLVLLLILKSNFKKIIQNIWIIEVTEKIDYKKEIFPYQWKIALSWISGYFVFQLFNPVLFATEGAVVAGQMGMTLAALNGIQALSLSWMNTKIPLYSGLIAQKQYEKLDIIFNRTLKQSIFINGSVLLLMFFIIFLMRHFHIVIAGIVLDNRFLSYIPMILMAIPLFINQFIFSWAIYLRCHKREPFLLYSIIGGLSCCLSIIFTGRYWGVVGITGGYCLITIILSVWAYTIFVSKKKEWHKILT